MNKPKIPDRSNEPALQESLDHGAKSTTAANSDDVANRESTGARDDEGNLVPPKKKQGRVGSVAGGTEEKAGVPESSAGS